MGGGGGLQATDLRRRLESTRCSSGATTRRPQTPPRSLRRDGNTGNEHQEERWTNSPPLFSTPLHFWKWISRELANRALVGNWFSGRVESVEASLASGQPTCTGWRPCRRQDGRRKEDCGARGGWRRWWNGGVIARGIVGTDDGEKEEGGRSGGKRHRLRWCRGDLRWIADVATRTLLLGIVLFVTPGTCFSIQPIPSFLPLFFSLFFSTNGNLSSSFSSFFFFF